MESMEAPAMIGSEGVGHTPIISAADMERIKIAVTAKVTEVIPEVLPGILVDVVPDVISRILPNIIAAIETKTISHIEARHDAERIMYDNPTKFNECTKRRKKFFTQHERCESLIQLYDECLQETPSPYIPRKFREDKFHVMDEEELEIVNRRSLANLTCQYDILSKRKRDFALKVNQEDDKIYEHVEAMAISAESKIEIINIWQKDTKGDENKVKQEWKRKVTEMKQAYAKDKEILAEKNRSRFGDRRNVTVRNRNSSRVPERTEQSDDNEDDPGNGNNDQDTDHEDEHEEADEDIVSQTGNESAIHGFTDDTTSPVGDHDEDDEFDFSDETVARVNDMAHNYEQENTSHFREVDHRGIPPDFFQSKMPTQLNQQQELRRNTFPSY